MMACHDCARQLVADEPLLAKMAADVAFLSASARHMPLPNLADAWARGTTSLSAELVLSGEWISEAA